MPQPKVSSGPSRSTTRISRDGSCRFMRMAKYNPAGPPPITFIFLISDIKMSHCGHDLAPKAQNRRSINHVKWFIKLVPILEQPASTIQYKAKATCRVRAPARAGEQDCKLPVA